MNHGSSLPDAQPGQISRRALWLIALIAIGHIVLVWLTRIPGITWGEDDVGYLLLGQDLRNFGYRELQDIAAPTHARFPPGFPLFLAIFGLPFGDNIDALLFLGALCTAVSVVLVFDTARRLFDETIGLLAAGLFALSPAAIIDAQRLASEPLFKLLVIAGMWALTVTPRTARLSNIAVFALFGAAMTRTAGIVLLPGLVLLLALRREYRRAVATVALIAVGVGGWMAWTLIAPEAADRRLYTSVVGLRAETIEKSAPLVERVMNRLPYLLTEGIPGALELVTIPGTRVDNFLWLILLAVLGGIGTVVLAKRWPEGFVLTASYSVILVGYVYLLRRFIHPVVPFVLLALLVGAAWIALRFFPRLKNVVLAALALALAAGPTQRAVRQLRESAACDRSDPANDTDCLDVDKRAYLKLAHWVRDSTDTKSLYFVPNERGFFYHSRRLTINQDRGLKETSTTLAPYLRERGVTHAVGAVVGPRGWEEFHLLALACRDFDLVRSFDDRAFLFAVRAATDTSRATPACKATSAFSGTDPSNGVDE